MKKIISSLLAGLLLLTLAVSAFGYQDKAADKKTDSTEKKKAPSNNTNFVGEITTASATSITVKTKTAGDKTATVNDKTKIKHEADGSHATAADLKTGERAHIWASKDKSGAWVATTIRVGNPAPKKTTKKETTKKAG